MAQTKNKNLLKKHDYLDFRKEVKSQKLKDYVNLVVVLKRKHHLTI